MTNFCVDLQTAKTDAKKRNFKMEIIVARDSSANK